MTPQNFLPSENVYPSRTVDIKDYAEQPNYVAPKTMPPYWLYANITNITLNTAPNIVQTTGHVDANFPGFGSLLQQLQQQLNSFSLQYYTHVHKHIRTVHPTHTAQVPIYINNLVFPKTVF